MDISAAWLFLLLPLALCVGVFATYLMDLTVNYVTKTELHEWAEVLLKQKQATPAQPEEGKVPEDGRKKANRARRLKISVADVKSMYARGLSMEAIARELNCSTATVADRLRAAGVAIRRRGWRLA